MFDPVPPKKAFFWLCFAAATTVANRDEALSTISTPIPNEPNSSSDECEKQTKSKKKK